MKKFLFLLVTVLTSSIVAHHVYKDSVTLFSLIFYLLSIIFCCLYFSTPSIKNGLSIAKLRINSHDFIFINILMLLQLFLLQYFANFPFHYIQDEFIAAYISFHLPPLTNINWFSTFPIDKTEWVNQFPILLFILQKPFLQVFGLSVESIRLSVWPYIILTILYLFLLAREYFSSRLFSFLTVAVFIFLAPNLYLSSLGVHFASSIFFILASLYYFILLQKNHEGKHAILCGIFSALGYLTYTSYYIVLPFLLMLLSIESIKDKSLRPIRLLLPSLIILFVILLPFGVYALTKHNFFTQRANQVGFLQTTWSNTQGKLHSGQQFSELFKKNITTNIRSLYTDDLGGNNDYWFGHKALFNPLTFALLLIGCITALYKTFSEKRLIYSYPLFIVLIIFFFGMVLTIPAGAFHRTFLAFPFIAVLIAMSFNFLSKTLNLISRSALATQTILIVILFIFLLTNFNSATEMIKKDVPISSLSDSLYINSYLKKHIPKGTSILISAFPSYHLQKELFFRTNNSYTFVTNYFPSLLPLLKQNPMILLYPDTSQIQQLQRLFPRGKIIDNIHGSKLKHHILFIPSS